MVVAFASIIRADTETKIPSQSRIKPPIWKRYIDYIENIFSLLDVNNQEYLNKEKSLIFKLLL